MFIQLSGTCLKANQLSDDSMVILKNIVLFLSGILLIVFGFKANTDVPAVRPAGQTGNAIPEADSPEAEQSREMPVENAQEKPVQKPGKPGQAGKTRLEKKTPEKAGGSQ